MARLFTEPKLIVASHNKGKLVEIADLLTRFEVETVGADALGLPEPEETGTTFIANAELKALAAAMTAGLPALSDDSGLAVDALDGAPNKSPARHPAHQPPDRYHQTRRAGRPSLPRPKPLIRHWL